MCLVQATRNDRSFVIMSALNNAVHFLHQSQNGTPATGFKPYLKASQLNRPSAPAVRVLFFICLDRGAKEPPLPPPGPRLTLARSPAAAWLWRVGLRVPRHRRGGAAAGGHSTPRILGFI